MRWWVVVVLALLPGAAIAEGEGSWFKSLRSPFTPNCCAEADCHRVPSKFIDGFWYALSLGLGTWVKIDPKKITDQQSIFPDAVLCESGAFQENGVPKATIWCFAIPPPNA